ncbi:dihydrolipoyl dehydrogenase, partial [Candidatus Woesebacteria bacterium]
RGSSLSKLLLHHADLIKNIETARKTGMHIVLKDTNFENIMQKVREVISSNKKRINDDLDRFDNVDFYPCTAEFVDPYIVTVSYWRALPPQARISAPEDENITSKMFFLSLGSRPKTPSIKGMNRFNVYTSDNIMEMKILPNRLAIVGGGFVAAEYAHFFSAMGSEVTIIGRNRRFLPKEEPEISQLAEKELGKSMAIITNHEVRKMNENSSDEKILTLVNRGDGKETQIIADDVLLAAGRSPNTTFIHPVRGDIKTDDKGWLIVNEYLETPQRNIWSFGDANGRYQFKHAADYEARIVYENAINKRKVKVSYDVMPHAIFTYPEIAGVGLSESESLKDYGEENILIGFSKYEDTVKGEIMDLKDFFAKIITHKSTGKILGAHIIGPYASIIIQEIVTLMHSSVDTYESIINGVHIHPSLSEVLEKALSNLMAPERYRRIIER